MGSDFRPFRHLLPVYQNLANTVSDLILFVFTEPEQLYIPPEYEHNEQSYKVLSSKHSYYTFNIFICVHFFFIYFPIMLYGLPHFQIKNVTS